MKTILFQGDSITDCERRSDKEGYGKGYVKFFKELVAQKHPEKEVTIVNRGISGNRTGDLVERWQADCIDLAPDVTVVLIGINDVWRKLDSGMAQSSVTFTKNIRYLFEKLKSIKSKIAVIEPFLLPCGNGLVNGIREELDAKLRLLRAEAVKYANAFIPADGLFYGEMINAKKPATYYSADGVHLTDEGAKFLAQNVLKAVVKYI